MGSPVRYACCMKKMLGWIHEKMAIKESTPRAGRYPTFDSIVTRNGASACNDSCAPSEDCLTAGGNGSWDNAHTSDPSSRGERPSREPSASVQCA
jgi:hypothetical protein